MAWTTPYAQRRPPSPHLHIHRSLASCVCGRGAGERAAGRPHAQTDSGSCLASTPTTKSPRPAPASTPTRVENVPRLWPRGDGGAGRGSWPGSGCPPPGEQRQEGRPINFCSITRRRSALHPHPPTQPFPSHPLPHPLPHRVTPAHGELVPAGAVGPHTHNKLCVARTPKRASSSSTRGRDATTEDLRQALPAAVHTPYDR